MERVKQALDRARAERQGSGAPARKPEFKQRMAQRQAPPPPQEMDIVYTQTRTIEFLPQTLRENRIIIGHDNDAISDAYKVLRTHVLQRMGANQWNSLAITSPTDGNGKTLTSINMAISIAREVNHSVLLVDLDLRRPNIHTYFGPDEFPGISDYLLNDVELSDILFSPGIERMVVLPGKQAFANSSEMLSSPKMVKLVEELKARYPNRIVLFDLPPILSCDDMMAFTPYVDAVMLVLEQGKTQKDELKRAYELLKEMHIIGTVLNKSDQRGSAYGYY